MRVFMRRIVGAAKLDAATYEEVEVDVRATWQALGLVALSSLAAGVGAFGGLGIGGVLTGVVVGIAAWWLWAWLTFFIGTRLLAAPETKSNWGELLRTTGFAMSPGLLGFLGVFPSMRGFIFVVADIWVLAAFVVAVRQALDYRSVWRALAVCGLGWVIYAGVILMALWAGTPGP